MLILGLNAYHGDSAACLVRNGHVLAAAEEERFRRIKHWAGLPTEAIRYCLEAGQVKLSDVEHVAINRKPGVHNARRIRFALTHRPDPRLVLQKVHNMRKAAAVEHALKRAFPRSELRAAVHHIEHHLAHLASAYFVSGFDEAVCLSVDGFGDFASAAWGLGRGGDIRIDGRVYFPHSLGIFFTAITQFIGFPGYGDEYKVMGLASYGEPRYLEQMRQIVRVQPDGTYQLNLRCFRHHTANVNYSWDDCAPEFGEQYEHNALSELLGPPRAAGDPLEQRHKDIARSAQAMYEEAFFALLNALHARYGCPNLALSGGCAMNSVANGKVYLRSSFRKMYLPAAAGDAGGAIGAALVVQQGAGSQEQAARSRGRGARGREQTAGNSEPALGTAYLAAGPEPVDGTAYLGPEFDAEYLHALLKDRMAASHSLSAPGALLRAPCSALHPAPCSLPAPSSSFWIKHHSSSTSLCRETAGAIADGKVVGWFQGRMEWGPRALGNRSILGDPRRPGMKAILNAKIKRRESFRPFAPSVLREHVSAWFEQDDDVPFMMQVFQIKAEKRPLVPAVCHVDGSGRLQTVTRDSNPIYYELISEFFRLTSVPMILNTSFNENEPVVCRPEEALDCFLRTQMDMLVMGHCVVQR